MPKGLHKPAHRTIIVQFCFCKSERPGTFRVENTVLLYFYKARQSKIAALAIFC
jgi:hypothetical protein